MEVSENAQIIPKNIPFEGPKFLDDLGSVSTKEAIVFNNNEYANCNNKLDTPW